MIFAGLILFFFFFQMFKQAEEYVAVVTHLIIKLNSAQNILMSMSILFV